jgi:hypothetical protein
MGYGKSSRLAASIHYLHKEQETMNTSNHAELLAHLTLLTVPVPPNLAEALGYAGTARWIGCYWTPYGDEVVWDDGRVDATGEWDAYLAFTQHPKVYPAVRSYRLGSSEDEARDMLIIDREEHKAYIAPRALAAALLDAQWPPLPQIETVPMSAEALNAQLLEALNLDAWTEERVVVSEDEITRRMEAREQRIASMMEWFDKHAPL